MPYEISLLLLIKEIGTTFRRRATGGKDYGRAGMLPGVKYGNEYSLRPMAISIYVMKGRADMLPAVRQENEYSLRPTALSINVTNGERHPPSPRLRGTGCSPSLVTSILMDDFG